MNKKKDVRENCPQCAVLYGAENPKTTAVRNCRNFIAVTKDDPKKPSLIMIVPKTHKRKVSDIMDDQKLAEEAQNFVGEVIGYFESRKKSRWAALQILWKDGREVITVSQTYTHLKTHAHAEIHIIY